MLLRIELRLVEEMLRCRVGALTENQKRAGRGPLREFDDGDVSIADSAVPSLLAFNRPGAEGQDGAGIGRRARNRDARLGVAEGFLGAAGMDALQTVDIAPGDAPGSPIGF